MNTIQNQTLGKILEIPQENLIKLRIQQYEHMLHADNRISLKAVEVKMLKHFSIWCML